MRCTRVRPAARVESYSRTVLKPTVSALVTVRVLTVGRASSRDTFLAVVRAGCVAFVVCFAADGVAAGELQECEAAEDDVLVRGVIAALCAPVPAPALHAVRPRPATTVVAAMAAVRVRR